MKILFVSTQTNPFGLPTNGDSQRTRLLLKACARIGEVDVVTFVGSVTSDIENVHVVHGSPVASSPHRIGKLEKWRNALCATDLQPFFSVDHEREKIIDRIVNDGNYDCIVSRYIYRTLPCGLWKYRQQLVVDFDDALPFYFTNQLPSDASFSARMRTNIVSHRAILLSQQAIAKMKAAFFAEKGAADTHHATYLPNIPYYQGSCDIPDFNVPFRRMLFVGHLDYAPNRDGMNHFLEHIYKPLSELIPNIELHIVGHLTDRPTAERWQSYRGVTLTGFVDDLNAEYQSSHVVIAPVYRCGGTNIKLLEAMQMNRACITTDAALKHLQPTFENQRDIIGVTSDHEYAEALVHLLSHPEANVSMARNGFNQVQRHYSFDSFASIVADTLTCR